MATWRLYIDETGDFADPGAHVAVAGLLLDVAVAVTDPAALRAAITIVALEIPWPVHAAHTKVPVMWAMWGENCPPSAWHDAARNVAEALTRRAPMLWHVVAGTTRAGRQPKLDEVKQLQAVALQHAARDLEVLSRHATQVRARLRSIPTALTSLLGPGNAAILVAETTPGEVVSGDRYLVMLGGLLRRVVDLLSRIQTVDKHEVWVGALQRNVVEPVLGRSTPLHVRHLAPLCAVANSTPGPGPAAVRLLPWEVPDYRGNLAAGYMLADQTAFDARGILCRLARQPLGTLLSVLETDVGWRFAAGSPALPSVAAGGVAGAWIESCRGQPPQLPERAHPLNDVRTWPREQALLWAKEVAQ